MNHIVKKEGKAMFMRKYIFLCLLVLFCFSLCCSCDKKVTNGDDQHPWQSHYCPAASMSGKVADYFNGAGEHDKAGMYLYDLNEGTMTRLVPGTAGYGGVDFSPNGQWIVYSTGLRVYKYLLSDGTVILLASDTVYGYCCFPSWSPDGKKIAFDKAAGPKRGIYFMDPDGNNQVLKIPYGRYPSWGQDRIVFHKEKSGYIDIYSYDLDSDKETRLTELLYASEPSVSSVGIAFTYQEDNKMPQVWIMGLNGEDAHPLTSDGGCNPTWWGNQIIYVKPTKEYGGLWRMSSNGSNQKPLL